MAQVIQLTCMGVLAGLRLTHINPHCFHGCHQLHHALAILSVLQIYKPGVTVCLHNNMMCLAACTGKTHTERQCQRLRTKPKCHRQVQYLLEVSSVTLKGVVTYFLFFSVQWPMSSVQSPACSVTRSKRSSQTQQYSALTVAQYCSNSW